MSCRRSPAVSPWRTSSSAGCVNPAHEGMDMMVTWVRGLFKDIHGRLELDWDLLPGCDLRGRDRRDRDLDRRARPRRAPAQRGLLRRRRPPEVHLRRPLHRTHGSTSFKGEVDLTIRGATRTVALEIACLGEWKTP